MNHPLIRYLCCPRCKRMLKIGQSTLTCARCKKTYPITNGISVLVDLSLLPQHLTKQIAYFEKEDAMRKEFVLEPWQERYVDNFVSVGKPRTSGLIVDNATGSGYMAIELAKKGFHVIAIDLTMAELVKLKNIIKKNKLSSKILLVCASSESLPLQTGVSDGLVANAILEHLPHEKKAVSEMARVLKPRAPLMLAMPINFRYIWPFLWFVNVRHDRRIGHLRRYNRARILSLLPRFVELKTYYTGSMWKILGILLKIFTKSSRWDALSERLDAVVENIPYGTNNVVSILRKP